MTVLRHQPLEDSSPDAGRRHLVRAWVAAALVGLMVVLMPAVPVILAGVGLGIEEATFLTSVGMLAVFVLLLDAFAVVAVLSGRRARRSGSPAATVPLAISTAIASLMTLLLLLTVTAHLLGFA